MILQLCEFLPFRGHEIRGSPLKRFLELFDRLNVVQNNLISLAFFHFRQFPRSSPASSISFYYFYPIYPTPTVTFIFVRSIARGIETAESRPSNQLTLSKLVFFNALFPENKSLGFIRSFHFQFSPARNKRKLHSLLIRSFLFSNNNNNNNDTDI